jgi:hypothetical protein
MPQTANLEGFTIRSPIAEFAAALGDERLLSREQAAVFLGVSPRTVDYFCAMARGCRRTNRTVRGQVRTEMPASPQKLPHLKIGHKVFFQLGDLRAFRDQRKVAA